MKDSIGQELQEGRFVAVGQRSGNSGYIAVGIVLRLNHLKPKKWYEDEADEVWIWTNGSSQWGKTFAKRCVALGNTQIPSEMAEKLNQRLGQWRLKHVKD